MVGQVHARKKHEWTNGVIFSKIKKWIPYVRVSSTFYYTQNSYGNLMLSLVLHEIQYIIIFNAFA